jgi:hypothetical protein
VYSALRLRPILLIPLPTLISTESSAGYRAAIKTYLAAFPSGRRHLDLAKYKTLQTAFSFVGWNVCALVCWWHEAVG